MLRKAKRDWLGRWSRQCVRHWRACSTAIEWTDATGRKRRPSWLRSKSLDMKANGESGSAGARSRRSTRRGGLEDVARSSKLFGNRRASLRPLNGSDPAGSTPGATRHQDSPLLGAANGRVRSGSRPRQDAQNEKDAPIAAIRAEPI